MAPSRLQRGTISRGSFPVAAAFPLYTYKYREGAVSFLWLSVVVQVYTARERRILDFLDGEAAGVRPKKSITQREVQRGRAVARDHELLYGRCCCRLVIC